MDSLEDRALTFLAVGFVVLLAWRITAPRIAAPAPRDREPVIVGLPLPSRVLLVADAIAKSEGYYANGIYAGHSLPYFLNNPGSLKATAIVDDDLPTWRDTGLLVFDTPEMGWTALHQQVCLMLTGTSRHYTLSDSLHLVGLKYADGDPNWGVNVARHLRLTPQATLAELGSGLPAGFTCLAA
jgi:hypothetical protein